MYRIFFCSLLFAGASCVVAQADEQEPATRIRLEVDGVMQELNDGGSIAVPGGKADRIGVHVADTKRLQLAPYGFDYPRHFAFAFERSEGMRQWSLDGNDVVIMLFEVAGDLPTEQFAEGLVEQFGKRNTRTEPLSLELAATHCTGERIHVETMGQKLTVDLLKLPTADGNTHLIYVQDMPGSDGSLSEEGKATMALLRSSFGWVR